MAFFTDGDSEISIGILELPSFTFYYNPLMALFTASGHLSSDVLLASVLDMFLIAHFFGFKGSLQIICYSKFVYAAVILFGILSPS